MNVRRLIGMCCVSVSFFVPTYGQGSSVSTPAARQLNRWLAAFDSTDSKVYPAFLQQNFPSGAATRTHDQGLRRNTAGFDLLKVEQNTTSKVTALLQERAGDGLARISLEVKTNEPFQIVRL